MKIAINAVRVSRQGGGGIDHYVTHLANRLADQGLLFDLYTFVPEHFNRVDPSRIFRPFRGAGFRPSAATTPSAPASEPRAPSGLRREAAKALGDPLKMFWTQAVLPFRLGFGGYDLLFSPSQIDALPWTPPGVRQVIAVLDAIPFLFPEQAHKHGLYLKAVFPLALKSAAHLIAISDNTKRDFIKMFGVPADKITVTPLAKPDLSVRPPAAEDIRRIRKAHGLARYVLCVSGNHPHKNLPLLIEAFAKIKDRTDAALIVAGFQEREMQQELVRRVEDLGLKDKVRFLGHVRSEDLPALYAGAEAFVFPSLYEGFGLPPLEALSYGVPTIVSRSSSLPEVVGDAGLYCDPRDPADLASQLEGLLGDRALRERLRAEGPKRAAQFSWEKTAAATAEVFRRVLKAD